MNEDVSPHSAWRPASGMNIHIDLLRKANARSWNLTASRILLPFEKVKERFYDFYLNSFCPAGSGTSTLEVSLEPPSSSPMPRLLGFIWRTPSELKVRRLLSMNWEIPFRVPCSVSVRDVSYVRCCGHESCLRVKSMFSSCFVHVSFFPLFFVFLKHFEIFSFCITCFPLFFSLPSLSRQPWLRASLSHAPDQPSGWSERKGFQS